MFEDMKWKWIFNLVEEKIKIEINDHYLVAACQGWLWPLRLFFFFVEEKKSLMHQSVNKLHDFFFLFYCFFDWFFSD